MHRLVNMYFWSLFPPHITFSTSPIVRLSFCIVTADETFGVTCLFRFDFLPITFEQLPLNTRFTNTSFKGTNMCVAQSGWHQCMCAYTDYIAESRCIYFLLIDCTNTYISSRKLLLYGLEDYELLFCFVFLNFLPMNLQEKTPAVLTSWLLFIILVHKHYESFFCSFVLNTHWNWGPLALFNPAGACKY